MSQWVWKPINIDLGGVGLSHDSLIGHHVVKVFSLSTQRPLNPDSLPVLRVAPYSLISFPFFILDPNTELLFGILQPSQHSRIIPHFCKYIRRESIYLNLSTKFF